MSSKASEGGAASSDALKGLRLCTMDRASDGYGFHMYTNKQLRGQYIKWVSPNSPADLAGVLPGDHVLQVDEIDVLDMPHHKVVEIIRSGDGKGRKVLVIDKETEKEMNDKEEKIDPALAIVMIPRAPKPVTSPSKQNARTSSPVEEVDSGTASPTSPTSLSPPEDVPPLNLDDMSAALPKKRGTKRAQVKNRDWKASVQAYNAL